MAKKGKLTEKQQRFVDEYLIDLNATQAAIRAGYSVKTADAIGCENLTKPNIQQAIAEHMAERSRRTGVNQDRVVLELAKIAFVRMTDVVDSNGRIKQDASADDLSCIPLVIPIQQDQVVKALKTNSKLSSGLYKRLGEDVDYLKRSIRAELSRGISSGSSWNEMAIRIANGMNSQFNKAINNAIRIARTEGHRIQNEAALDGQHGAKKKGADIVKQWDSTLDSRTRPEHRECDGQIREIDEPFDVGGEKMQAPGVGGSARNVCNCRCCLLQRAKWALDDDELKTLQERAAFFGLDKTKDFEDFKQKYLKLPDNADTMKVETLSKPKGSDDSTYDAFFKTLNDRLKVPYNTVENQKIKMTSDEIIKTLSGGDLTGGSCASLGLAYIGQKQGWNVLDFRGGESQNFFSNTYNLKSLFETKGIKKITAKGACTATVGKNLLKQCEVGKEYYLYVGRHAAIVRKALG